MSHCLQGKRVVLIGDSTLRYEYLALALTARRGHPPHVGDTVSCAPGAGPSPLYEKLIADAGKRGELPAATTALRARPGCQAGWTNYERFYRYTSEHVLGRSEACDCWRARCCEEGPPVENRVYAGDSFSLSYFAWYGAQTPPTGTWDVVGLLADGRKPASGACPPGQRGNTTWQMLPDVLLDDLVRRARPTHVIVNSGWHSTTRLGPRFFDALAAAGARAQAAGVRMVWRTTPRPLNMSARQRATVLGLRGVVASLDDVDDAPFRRSGWAVWDAKASVRAYERAAGSRRVFFPDSIHLRPAATVANVDELLALLCDGGGGGGEGQQRGHERRRRQRGREPEAARSRWARVMREGDARCAAESERAAS